MKCIPGENTLKQQPEGQNGCGQHNVPTFHSVHYLSPAFIPPFNQFLLEQPDRSATCDELAINDEHPAVLVAPVPEEIDTSRLELCFDALDAMHYRIRFGKIV